MKRILPVLAATGLLAGCAGSPTGPEGEAPDSRDTRTAAAADLPGGEGNPVKGSSDVQAFFTRRPASWAEIKKLFQGDPKCGNGNNSNPPPPGGGSPPGH